ncbi:hypothetical protein [Methylacidimicrobium sp. B4]|uniref:hypothetical protein n=1 Tax=Methylacidimicrobium sp. B4 TaxID=2796139 RepID=UPI001A8C3A05|nr:hypothetical protein [Methylacidimicrobium sp. B4]QSR84194.1 hypothetical protein MacB4_08125 [Methylacidimicrobium sp. B4]
MVKKLFGLLGLVFLGALAIVFCVAAAYWNGEGFRSYLSRAVAKAIGVEGRFSPLRFRGIALGSDEFSGVGGPSSPIAELRAERLEARVPFSALAHGIWRIDPLRVGHLELAFRSVGPEEKPMRSGAQPAARQEASGAPELAAGLGRVSLDRGDIETADLRWPASILGGGALTGTRVTMEADASAWNGRASGGRLTCASLPSLALEELRFRLDSGAISLEEGKLHSEGSGSIRLAGSFRWEEPERGELHFSSSGVALSPWLPQAWRNRVEGELEAKGELDAARGRPWKVDADLSLFHGKLEDLPWLVGLALKGGAGEALPLDQAEAHLRAGPEGLTFERIAIESKGRLRVEGDLRVQGEQLHGSLMVGLSPERVALLPGAREKIFSEERGGYLWAPVAVTGTVRDPQEDLSPRVAALAREAVKAGVERAIHSALDFLRRSQQPPKP